MEFAGEKTERRRRRKKRKKGRRRAEAGRWARLKLWEKKGKRKRKK